MKHWIALMSLAFGIVGCNVKSSEQVKHEVDEVVRKSQTEAAQLTSPYYVGGQPGRISVKGFVVKKGNGSFELDNRIKTTQVGGKGNRGTTQMQVTEQNKTLLSDAADLQSIAKYADLKTYINLGCANLTAAETEGLTAQAPTTETSKDVLILSATKIFVCGPQRPSQTFVTLASEELIMKNGAFGINGSAGSLYVATNKLTLEGTNTLFSAGLDATINVLPAPTVDLAVGKAINGEGTLLLQSTGGNCVSPAP
jgi:hypothetical protein